MSNLGTPHESSSLHYTFAPPSIYLYCSAEPCGGYRFFSGTSDLTSWFMRNKLQQQFIRYVCQNCGQSRKTIAVAFKVTESDGSGSAYKFGEEPPFGPHVPPRVVSLIGPDRELFLKARRCETQGLGVGAFAYYRRVVENQKGRLLDEIIRVAERTRAAPETIELLRRARGEQQFSRAVEMVRDAIPDSLRIEGHNPLTLLHSALSEGLHAQSDEDCLDLAASIREVLTDLADRVGRALQDHAGLTQALSRLMRPAPGGTEPPAR